MTRVLLTACCALLSVAAWGQKAKPGPCPAFPAQCQINAPVFNFGRHPMSSTAPPVYTHGTISVTCIRHPQDRLSVDVAFELKGLPPEPARQMRDQIGGAYLRYDMFVDPARTRYWGDGYNGTFAIEGALFLDDRNRVGTTFHVLYGRVDGGQLFRPGPGLGAVLSRLVYRVDCR